MGIVFFTTFGTAFAESSWEEYDYRINNDPLYSDCEQIIDLNNIYNELYGTLISMYEKFEIENKNDNLLTEIELSMRVLGFGYLFHCSTIEYQESNDMLGIHNQFFQHWYELTLHSDKIDWNEWEYGDPQQFTSITGG